MCVKLFFMLYCRNKYMTLVNNPQLNKFKASVCLSGLVALETNVPIEMRAFL